MNARLRVFSGALAALLLLLFVAVCPVVFAQSGAASAIDAAKDQLVSCYEAVRAAEGAGANISFLIAVLNDAGALLSSAEFAYAVGDFGAANDLAAQSTTRLEGFVSEAEALRASAEAQGNFDFWVYTVSSAVGTFAVLGGAYILWVFLSRRYGGVRVDAGESSRV
jgi:hypothetical protein